LVGKVSGFGCTLQGFVGSEGNLLGVFNCAFDDFNYLFFELFVFGL
jgi:hypothetical protein